jgi:hypothetical protein
MPTQPLNPANARSPRASRSSSSPRSTRGVEHPILGDMAGHGSTRNISRTLDGGYRSLHSDPLKHNFGPIYSQDDRQNTTPSAPAGLARGRKTPKGRS